MIFLSEIENTFRFQSSQSGVDHYKVRVYFTVSLGTLDIAEDLVPVLDEGYYYVLGLKEIVQAYMEQNNYSLFTLGITARPYNADDEWMEELDDISVSDEVLYNSLKLRGPASSIVNQHFMTRHNSMLIAEGVNYMLHWEHGSVGDTFNVVYKLKDGTTLTFTENVNAVSGFTVIGRAQQKDAISAYAKYGSRELTLYYQDQPEHLIFEFRNMFNVVDRMTLPASVETSPSTEYEEASVNQVSQHYDVEHGMEYKVKTGALTEWQLDVLVELCRSREVRMYRNLTEGWIDMLVKDYKLPKSNNPNTPRTAELTLVPRAYEDNTVMLLT